MRNLIQRGETAPTDLLDTDEAARLIGVQPQTLNLWRCTGRYALPFVRVGSRIRYRRKDLESWLASRTATSTAAAIA